LCYTPNNKKRFSRIINLFFPEDFSFCSSFIED